MEIPAELLFTALVTPILGAIATLFWLLNKEKDKRISDRDTSIANRDTRIVALESAIQVYRDQIVPTLRAQQAATEQLADLLERQDTREKG
jgi:hypothetical protein